MSDNNFGLGGTEVKLDAFEAFGDIPSNRVLMAEKLTAQPPVKPEIVDGLSNVEEVFAHFGPKVEMTFDTEEGTTRRETLRFKNLGDFGTKGISAQSDFLNDLRLKQEQYQKMIKQLKTNKLLKSALSDPASKQNLISALNSLLAELKEAK